nr:DnaJ family domain-containing protein [Sporosarcina limicola]
MIGDILKKYTEQGGMDNLKGHGKPLPEEYFSGDTFQHFQRIAMDGGHKPHWLKLQHEVRDEIEAIAALYTVDPMHDLEQRISELNEKISEHNKCCPPPMLKGSVYLSNLETAMERWK